SFRALTAADADAFYAGDTSYAQARYLLYYLQEQGLLRELYRRFRADRARDPTGYSILVDVLGARDMAAFQRRWQAWVLGLECPGCPPGTPRPDVPWGAAERARDPGTWPPRRGGMSLAPAPGHETISSRCARVCVRGVSRRRCGSQPQRRQAGRPRGVRGRGHGDVRQGGGLRRRAA